MNFGKNFEFSIKRYVPVFNALQRTKIIEQYEATTKATEDRTKLIGKHKKAAFKQKGFWNRPNLI
jgi:hypothetical protein